MANPRPSLNKPLITFTVLAVVVGTGAWFAPALLRHGERLAVDGEVGIPSSVDQPADAGVSTPAVLAAPATGPGEVPKASALDFQASLKQLAASAVSSDWGQIDKLLSVCMAENPAETAAYLDAARLGGNRELVLTRVAQLWSAHDPVAALQWAVRRDDVGEQESLAGAVYLKWAEADPASAVSAAEQVGGLNTTRMDVTRNLVSQWAARDLPASVSWVKARPPGDSRTQLIEQVAIRLAETSPASAVGLVEENIPPGNRHNEAIIAVLHQWALHDFSGAKAWASHFPVDEVMSVKIRNELDAVGAGL